MTEVKSIQDTKIPQFALSHELFGHSQDVKAVAIPTSSLLFSASRDGTIRQWTLDGTSDTESSIKETEVYSLGTAFVNCVAYMLPSRQFPQGLVIAGGTDRMVTVFMPCSNEPIHVLAGHSQNVCSLDIDSNGTIVSGSWDNTCCIWVNWKLHALLAGHSQAIWAVLIWAGYNMILTGSADKTIRLWSNEAVVRIYQGHTDCVRALCKLGENTFASCGNDSIILVWHIEGSQLHQLHGHTSFIYSLALLPSNEIISSGEDRSVRIWRNFELVQTIVIPAVSVWTVASSPSGDIICGSSDGVVRIFTRDNKRRASDQTLRAFEDNVASQAIPSTQVGDINKESLPGLEALDKPGNKDSQVIMVRNGERVEAYQWSACNWQKIGDVVDAVGSGRRQLYDGKEYDYVFDVEVQKDAPSLKLPYNSTENPWSAAKRFLEQNDLDMAFLEQVAEFIVKNTESVKLGGEYNSPYGGRYRPGEQTEDRQSTLPQTSYLSFKQVNFEGIRKKIRDLNDTVDKIDEELLHIDFICSRSGNVDQIDDAGIKAILKIATLWSKSSRFPGLDLLRIVVFYHVSVDLLEILLQPEYDLPNQGDTNLMLGLRALVNFFHSKDGRDLLMDRIERIFSLLAAVSSQNKNVRLARATWLTNSLATLVHELSKEDLRNRIISAIEKASHAESDPEIIYRLLIALGTTLSLPKPTPGMKQDAINIISKLRNLTSEKRIVNAIEDIQLVIA